MGAQGYTTWEQEHNYLSTKETESMKCIAIDKNSQLNNIWIDVYTMLRAAKRLFFG